MHRIVEKAPAHTSMLGRDFLVKSKTVIMPQPPYSRDLTHADCFLVPKLKTPMKGNRFATIEEMKKIETKAVGVTKSAFQKCFGDWKKRWHKCVISEVVLL